MTVELKAGSLSDFFASAKETAKEIDEGEKLTLSFGTQTLYFTC